MEISPTCSYHWQHSPAWENTESSLLFVIFYRQSSLLSVCQSSRNTTNKTIKSKVSLRHGNVTLFLCGNEGNWGNILWKKTYAWKWVYFCTVYRNSEGNSAEMRETEGKSCTLAFLLLYVSVQFYRFVEMCRICVRKYNSNYFREFHRIPQKRFPYSSAEFYGYFLRRELW